MKIRLRRYGEKSKELETSSSTLSDLLSELSINPETVIIRVRNEIVTPDNELEQGDEIELIPVVSGG